MCLTAERELSLERGRGIDKADGLMLCRERS
jgi:hypothetical protein